ncbi:hypothetical protein Tco_0570800, partial [Tanacetum coccineum]
MHREQAQLAARDEKLVPTKDRVKIGKSNLIMDPTLTDVPKFYMKHFCFTSKGSRNLLSTSLTLIKRHVKLTLNYFKKFLGSAQEFQIREFIVPPSNDSLFDFLLELGYKGQLKHISKMFVDHMHQPWRTLRAIINRCLSGKTSSNDILRPSRIEILWGIYHKVNVDYAALIWEIFNMRLTTGSQRSEEVRSCPIL